MKLLFDECVPAPLADHFVGHEVYTVEAAGYKGLKNGALLAAAGKKYDVLVTVDREIEFQQNLRHLPIAVVLIETRTNKPEHIQVLIAEVLAALRTISPREFKKISS